jgi:hypothetical protein
MAEVFVYTGEGRAVAPYDVIRIRVDPSVTSIPVRAFNERKKLAEVELCEGLVEIGEGAFKWCEHSITKINIPTLPGEFVIMPSGALFDVPFTSRALE